MVTIVILKHLTNQYQWLFMVLIDIILLNILFHKAKFKFKNLIINYLIKIFYNLQLFLFYLINYYFSF